MADHLFGAIELALVFGGVLGWGCWEIRATRLARLESERAAEEKRRAAGNDDVPR